MFRESVVEIIGFFDQPLNPFSRHKVKSKRETILLLKEVNKNLSKLTSFSKIGLMKPRRSYPVSFKINGFKITEVLIDPHYEINHSDSMNDELILKLVGLLDGKFFKPETIDSDFQYYVADPLKFEELNYRLVWLLENEKLYVGVVNAFRR